MTIDRNILWETNVQANKIVILDCTCALSGFNKCACTCWSNLCYCHCCMDKKYDAFGFPSKIASTAFDLWVEAERKTKCHTN